jgi:hypothetical protein
MLLSLQNTSFLDIIERMKDPEAVKASTFDLASRNPDPIYPDFPSWNDLSLAEGYPSLLLLFSTLRQHGFVDESKEDTIHRYVLKIKEALEDNGCDNFSLFTGVSGICFALQQASCEGTRYQRMLNGLHDYLLKNIEKVFLEPIRCNIDHNLPSFAYLYDPIQGICGIGRYLLENLSIPHFYEVTQNIVQVLVKLSLPLKINRKNIPGWYSPPNDPFNANNESLSPKGHFNLGLAHGITGILAFLAISFARGIQVKGQEEAMRRMINWIREKSFSENNTIHWPCNVSWEEEIEKKSSTNLSSRDAWCYGVPGIARTLFLAGKVLKDNELKSFASRAFRGVFCRSQNEWGLPGPMLCHGIAGLLLITREMAKEQECEDLTCKVQELEQILFTFYNPDFLFGFKEIEPCKNGGTAQINKAGFLGGATGVLLTLLDQSEHVSQWHLPFLMHA